MSPLTLTRKKNIWLQVLHVAALYLIVTLVAWGTGGLIAYSLSLINTSEGGGGSDFVMSLVVAAIDAGVILALCYVWLKLPSTWPAVARYGLLVVAYYFAEYFAMYTLSQVFKLWGGELFLARRSLVPTTIGIFFLLNDCLFLWGTYYYLQREVKKSKLTLQQQSKIEEMQAHLLRAELEALQAKVNPHFLYNALNSVVSLVHTQPHKAEEMVLLLAQFYRNATNRQPQHYWTIAHEIETVRNYLAIESIRFSGRLQYEVEVPDALLKEEVPHFLLQPLVENAVKHGASQLTADAQIKIEMQREGEALVFRIHDNGPPFNMEQAQVGYGLQSVQDKLHLLCKPGSMIELVNKPSKHVWIKIVTGHAN